MNIHEIANLTLSGLQCAVAVYALRLNRIFGTTRVGWLLFCTFAPLALLHFGQSLKLPGAEIGAVPKMEVIYALVSLVFLTGMMNRKGLFKERLRTEQADARMRVDLETEVNKQTLHLTRVLQELQSEFDERRRAKAELKAHINLLDLYRHRDSKVPVQSKTSPPSILPWN